MLMAVAAFLAGSVLFATVVKGFVRLCMKDKPA